MSIIRKKILKLKIKDLIDNFENFNKNISLQSLEKISMLKYLKGNAILKTNGILEKLFKFVDNMLWIRSLQDGNSYMGYTNGAEAIQKGIINNDKVKIFQKYLNEMEINIELEDKNEELYIKYENGIRVNFYQIASSGTKILALFFYWLMQLEKKASFLFIDEFDAYFHHDLSKRLLKRFFDNLEIKQIVLTSHSTFLIDNDILRPDCFYILNIKGDLKQFSELNRKKIEKYHDIEKMYIAGAFNYE